MDKTQELLQRAVMASTPELNEMVAAINKEIADSKREPIAWHNHMVRLRGAIAAIGNARFGYAWASGGQQPPV